MISDCRETVAKTVGGRALLPGPLSLSLLQPAAAARCLGLICNATAATVVDSDSSRERDERGDLWRAIRPRPSSLRRAPCWQRAPPREERQPGQNMSGCRAHR